MRPFHADAAVARLAARDGFPSADHGRSPGRCRRRGHVWGSRAVVGAEVRSIATVSPRTTSRTARPRAARLGDMALRQDGRPGAAGTRTDGPRPRRFALGVGGAVRRAPRRPALVLALGFLVLIAIGTVMLIAPDRVGRGAYWTHPLDALFTATSAVCVTGLVVVDTATHWRPSAGRHPRPHPAGRVRVHDRVHAAAAARRRAADGAQRPDPRPGVCRRPRPRDRCGPSSGGWRCSRSIAEGIGRS